jgi:hypothetical protein
VELGDVAVLRLYVQILDSMFTFKFSIYVQILGGLYGISAPAFSNCTKVLAFPFGDFSSKMM